MYYYLRYMGCIAWTITLVVFIVFLQRIIKKNGSLGLSIIYMVTDLVFGSAVGVLFYQVATLVK